MLNLCDFIQVYVFTINHHLKLWIDVKMCLIASTEESDRLARPVFFLET